MPVWLRGFANLLDQAGISLCGNGFAYIFYISHRQHPGVIRSAAVAYAVLLLKRENIGLNKIKVSEMGKYFDVLRIICHTEKKEEMESHQNR